MFATMRHTVLLVCLAVLLLAGLPAHAQDTGGSMGGGDFSSGGGGGGDFGSSGGDSGSYSYDPASSDSSGGSSSSGGGFGGFLMFFVLIVLVFTLVSWIQMPSTVSRSTVETLYLSSLALGIDWHARGELQKKLAALAAQKLGGTAEGRVKMLREVVLALMRAELSWLYVAYEAASLPRADAEPRFLETCTRARSRFRRELIRDEGGELTVEAPGSVAIRPEEGAGTVVVSLILVTRRPLAGWTGMADAMEIRSALSSRSSVTSQDLVAIEVAWSPAAEEDRMSTAELEQHYPELVLIDPKSIAGRLFCSYCGGAFAMELLNCPHCGAAVDRNA